MARLLSINTTDPDLVRGLQFRLAFMASMSKDIENDFIDSEKEALKKFGREFEINAGNPQKNMLDLSDDIVSFLIEDRDDLDEVDAGRELHMTVVGNKADKTFRFIATDSDGNSYHEAAVTHSEFLESADYKPDPLLASMRLEMPSTLMLLQKNGIVIDGDDDAIRSKIHYWLHAAMMFSVLEAHMKMSGQASDLSNSKFKPN